jgi:hypothetical protein
MACHGVSNRSATETALFRFGFGPERLSELRGRPANVRDNPVRSPEAAQVQLNPLQVGLMNFSAQCEQLFLRLLDFLGDPFQRETDLGHFVLPTSALRFSTIGKLGPIPGGVRGTAKV